jgi:SAM-dependent methyltransferase
MWKHAGAGDVSRLLPPSGQVVLYESENGLYFFEPRTPGDDEFYAKFYSSHKVHEFLSGGCAERGEFQFAAQYAEPGMSVLDVGCGNGILGGLLPNRHYRGLDPYAGPDADPRVIKESLDDHLAKYPASYDVVTAFHVIEHVDEPKEFAEKLTRLLKPGGLLILAAPLAHAPLTLIPNFPLNAAPHHLTWWSCSAFQALAESLHLNTVKLAETEPAPNEGLIYWMNRLSFASTQSSQGERYFAHRWLWHINLYSCYMLAKIVTKILPFPKGSKPNNVVLVARKPELANLD